jgi:hypothetical protein
MKALFAEHQPALGADIPNYTNTTPVFQVSQVMEDDFTDFPSLDEIRTGYGEDSPRESRSTNALPMLTAGPPASRTPTASPGTNRCST